VRDPVQPRTQQKLPVADAQRPVRAHEYVLERIVYIGAVARQHLAHVGEQPRPVAIVDNAERVVVPRPKQRHELGVRAQPQDW
jgi:hypothetical protein